MSTYLKKSRKRKIREKTKRKNKRKRKTKKVKRKNSRKSIKRKIKMKGGAGTPQKKDHSHSHAVYMCENHFNMIYEENTVCDFWHNILTQLIKRDINENSYNDQGSEGVREDSPCSCCAISNDISEKDCAVFRNLIYCSNDPPCGDITNTSQLCGECTFCTSI